MDPLDPSAPALVLLRHRVGVAIVRSVCRSKHTSLAECARTEAGVVQLALAALVLILVLLLVDAVQGVHCRFRTQIHRVARTARAWESR